MTNVMLYRYSEKLNRACYFAGAEAPRTYIDMAGRAVNHGLDTSDIGFPGSVGTSVRVGNLNPKRYTFSAEITFCHLLHLLRIYITLVF